MTHRSRHRVLMLVCWALFAGCGDDDIGGDASTPIDGGHLGGWRALASQVTPGEANPTGTLLADGRAVFWGGNHTAAFLVDVNADNMTEVTLGGLILERHSITTLPSGRIFGAGNAQEDFTEVAPEQLAPGASRYAALYDVRVGTISVVEMLDSRGMHTASLLSDGRVLLVGGSTGAVGMPAVDALERCEFFTESTNSFAAGPALAVGRYAHKATPLSDGRILVTGGRGDDGRALASVELYDSATNTWRTVAPMATARARHIAVRLGSGRVLVAGGTTGNSEGVTSAAEVYDASTDTWTSVPPLPIGVGAAGGVALPSGDAMITGGFDLISPQPRATRQALIFRDASSTWEPMADLLAPQYDHSMVVLADGHVLVGVGWEDRAFGRKSGLEVSGDAFPAR